MQNKLLTIFLLGLLSACGTSHRNRAIEYNRTFNAGNYCEAAKISTGKNVCEDSSSNLSGTEVLSSLNGGNALFICQKYPNSLDLYTQADQAIYEYARSSVVEDAGRGSVNLLANESILDYQPMVLDGIYLSSYKILNYLALGDNPGARNEVNRAYVKQQEASEYFRKEIEKGKAELSEERQEVSPEAAELTGGLEGKILSAYNQEFSKWNSYKDYMNPYTTYLSGLYLMSSSTGRSDNENAVTNLKRASGMSPQNKYIKQDLKLAENIANGKSSFKKAQPTVWVIFENGMVADFKEVRFDLPVFLATDNVKMVSFAVPTPQVRDQAYENISVAFGKNKPVKTELLADVDRMFISEYNKKFPVILGKAIASTVSKTIMQFAMQEGLGDLGGISMAVYSVVTTSADLRSWHSLPKNVQLAKLPLAKDGRLSIFNGTQKIAEVEVPQKQNSVVYVRIPAAGTEPAVSVIKL